MGINNYWRSKQLPNSFAQQEMLCLDFIKKHANLNWGWHGVKGKLYEHCSINYNCNQPKIVTGLIIINYPLEVTPGKFVKRINNLITDDIRAVYLAVNRFSFVAVNDLHIEYSDSISQSIAQIVQKICIPLQPLDFSQPEVDGNHFVGVHGLDIFTYEHS